MCSRVIGRKSSRIWLRLKRTPIQWESVPSKKHRQWTIIAKVNLVDKITGKEYGTRTSSQADAERRAPSVLSSTQGLPRLSR